MLLGLYDSEILQQIDRVNVLNKRHKTFNGTGK